MRAAHTEYVAQQYNYYQRTFESSNKEEKYLNYGYTLSNKDTYECRQRQLCIEVFNAAAIEPDHSIVDVGFGSGEQDFLLSREYNFKRLVGFNIAEEQVAYANNRAKSEGLDSKMKFICDEAEKMVAIPDNSIDRVLAIECAFYFDRPKFYRSAARILKKGGRLVLADICFSDALKFVTHLRMDIRKVGYFSGNKTEWENYFNTISVQRINKFTIPGAQMTVHQIKSSLKKLNLPPEEIKMWKRMAFNTQITVFGFTTRLIRYDLVVLEKK